jgi:hypothetical protein
VALYMHALINTILSYVGVRIILCVADHLVLFEQHACFNLRDGMIL